MPSSSWRLARCSRLLLLLGASTLALVVPLAAAHVACEHADEEAIEGHHCAVCRHLADTSPLLAATLPFSGPLPVAALTPPPALGRDGLTPPPARGRAPPEHVSVS